MRTSARLATLALLVTICAASALVLPQGAGSQAEDGRPAEGASTPEPGTFIATPAEGLAGTPITVSGAGCTLPDSTVPGDAVMVTLAPSEGEAVATVSLAVAADGTWTGAISAPQGTASGALQVGARCIAPEQELVSYAPQAHTVTGAGTGATPPPPASTLAAPDPALATAPVAASAAGSSNSGNAGLPTPNPSTPIEPLPSYDPQSTCSPTAKPGVLAFQAMVLDAFPSSGAGSISRSCSQGGTSEHKEGRAWDWGVNASNASQAGYARQVVDWLLATDSRGNRYANARRVGIMYIIWNRQMFRMYRPEDGWQPYSGSSPHTDHVHFSFTRDGAAKTTSFWNPNTSAPRIEYSSARTDVGGQFDPPVSGDFDGDGHEDVLWYTPADGADVVWWGRGDRGFTGASVAVNGTFTPVTGDFDGDGRDDVLWHAPGSAWDFIWYGNANRSFTALSYAVSGTYAPLAGDFDGDGRDDILWYGAGAAPDSLWRGSASRRYWGSTIEVVGTYQPMTGDFNGDGRDDVFWYGPGEGKDVVWYGTTSGFSGKVLVVSGVYPGAFAGDLNGDGRDDVVWYAPGVAKDSFWVGLGDRTFRHQPTNVDGRYDPAVPGDFDGNEHEDVLWYGPGSGEDWLWWSR